MEYWIKLREKLEEEVKEFLEDESAEELADIVEVLEAMVVYKGYDGEHVQFIKEKKIREQRGIY